MTWKRRLTEWLRPFDLMWDRVKHFRKSRKGSALNSPIQLLPYRGFCSIEKTWIKGRVLEDRLIVTRREDSAWRNLVNTYKRFNSREIWGAEVEVKLGTKNYFLQTDREGYYELEVATPKDFLEPVSVWLSPVIKLIRTPWAQVDREFAGEALFPLQPQFGIISDIDDTIIRTGVTSRLMWRAIYRTILKNAGSRVIFKEASAFFRAMSGYEPGGEFFNPVFYVSNSPWNLYDLINDFLAFNHLPKGPLLLRDLSVPAEPRSDEYRGHKYENIARIFRIYPQLNFVLIGDSGERDTDIYLEITQNFPGRVKAIYIRDVQHRSRTKRVRDLILNSGRTEVKLLSHFGEGVEHAENLGLLRRDIYDQLIINP